jgi:hypothetical protein
VEKREKLEKVEKWRSGKVESKLKVQQLTCYLLFHFLLFYFSTLAAVVVAAQGAATCVWGGV